LRRRAACSRGVHLARHLRMPSIRRRILATAIAGMLQQAAPALAQHTTLPSPHLRPDPGLRSLVADAAARSPSIQTLIDRLEAANVIVYVRTRMFRQSELQGRVGLIAVVDGRRFLAIELACGRPERTMMATLGHELHHAVEIAGEPSIVDAKTLAAFYTKHGIQTGTFPGELMFESAGAEEAGRRARREINAAGERHTWTLK
jgi:hypothetical protein